MILDGQPVIDREVGKEADNGIVASLFLLIKLHTVCFCHLSIKVTLHISSIWGRGLPLFVEYFDQRTRDVQI